MQDRVLRILKEGGIALLPTDTIPGIMTVYDNIRGLDRIFKLKKRDIKQSVAVLIGNIEQLKLLVHEVPGYAKKLMLKHWPGALTIVLPSVTGLPRHIVSSAGVAVRMPDYKPLRELIDSTGPLAATSINVHGNPPITAPSKVPTRFAKGVDYVLKDNYKSLDIPSTVIMFVNGNAEVLRQGAIKVK